MGNIEYEDGFTFIGRTHRNDDEFTSLIIPTDLAKHLQIENSKVDISLLNDFGGNRYLVVSKFHREITIE